MALFFFDTSGPGGAFQDEVGCDCAGSEPARSLARRTLYDIAADTCPDADQAAFTIRVRDLTGAEVYRATIALTGVGS
ncbi:hypothetical protein [Methylobacterium sp. CCH5-D2]|uniref:DUF6894 family protein n=1 Tax=Methylobacterium sp. CCH5-D2 TaxID=1768765 RepID=UPI000A7AFE90|nr:hypothetical protein [Methylobacterium sp. CCH5-D2]